MIMEVQLKATGLFSIHDSFVLPSSYPISKAKNSYFSVGVDSWHLSFFLLQLLNYASWSNDLLLPKISPFAP